MISFYQRFLKIINAINTHPLAGKHRLKSYGKFISWQLWNFIDSNEKKVSFTDRTFLLAKKSMKGATGNIYLGLHEFSDMGFLLHFLRKEDLFLDIGSNIGSYTILASGHVGCKTIAFEPIPSTYKRLKKNTDLNKIDHLVTCHNSGVGFNMDEKLFFTSELDCENHVIHSQDKNQNAIEVPIVSIDRFLSKNSIPALVKIDVEGFETEVLKGMDFLLNNNQLKAIIIELNGSGIKYGFDEKEIHKLLLKNGFQSYTYDPFKRKLEKILMPGFLNTLYVRDKMWVEQRLKTSEPITLFGEKF